MTLSGSLGLVGSKVGNVVLNSFTIFNMFNTFPKALINCTNDKSEKKREITQQSRPIQSSVSVHFLGFTLTHNSVVYI